MNNVSKNIIDIIEKISDLKFQKDVWLEGKYWDRVSSFEEGVNSLEDYSFFSDIMENNIKLPIIERQKIETFNIKLLDYDGQNAEIMLNDPNWKNIVEEAGQIVKILKKYMK